MNIFKRNKKIILDCYTATPYIYENFKPAPTNKFMPKWMDGLRKKKYGEIDRDTLGVNLDMRGCIGFTNIMSNGFIIPMWSDILIDVGEIGTTDYRFRFADPECGAEQHPALQRGDYLPEDKYLALKLNSPWVFKCSEEISFAWFQPTWNFDSPEEFVVLPAVVQYKGGTNSTNINFAMPRSETRKILKIEANQPMVQIIPMTERKIELRHHLVTPEEFEKINYPDGFKGSFTNRNSTKTKVKKCPFSGRV